MSDTLRINNLFTTAIGYSTLTGSTITTNSLSLSTLTVSSINSGAPGVAAYSTLNVSTLNATSTITGSTINAITGRIGIGTNAAAQKLDIVDSASVAMGVRLQSQYSAGYLSMGSVVGVNSYIGLQAGVATTSALTTPTLCVTNANNVGIGTANPGYLLTVGVVANPTANSAGTTVIQCNGNLNIYRNRLIFSGTPTDWNHCIYNNQGNLDNEGAWDGMKFNVYSGAWFRVGTAAATVPTTALFINSTGQVGIGLTNQTHSLQVYGALGLPTITTTGDFPSQLVLHSASAWLKIGHYYTGGVGSYSILQSSDYYSGSEHPCNLLLQPLGGNVGIGITNPSVPLQVNGTIIGTRMYSISGSLTVGTSATTVYTTSGYQSGFIHIYWGNGNALYFFQSYIGLVSTFLNQLLYNSNNGTVTLSWSGTSVINATANTPLNVSYIISFNT